MTKRLPRCDSGAISEFPDPPPSLVVVTGPPAAGKTAIAEALRAALGLPLLAKDAFKESLGESLGISEPSASRRLGAAVFDLISILLRELLSAGVSVVAEGNFAVGSPAFDGLPPARVVQVHVSAEPDTLRARLLARGDGRHPVHYDHVAATEIAARIARDDWDPLPLTGALVRVDTTTWPDLDSIVREVETLLA